MKVSELKARLAEMKDDDEISIDLEKVIQYEDMKNLRIRMNVEFPKEGMLLKDIIDDEEEMRELFDRCGGNKENIIEALYDWDYLPSLSEETISFYFD